VVGVEQGLDRQPAAGPYVEEGHPGKIHQRRSPERHHAVQGLLQILQVMPVELTPKLDQHTFVTPYPHLYTGHVIFSTKKQKRPSSPHQQL
jgi:hypothetical protein